MVNAYIGVGKDGATAVPNMGNSGVYVQGTAINCTIGAPGKNSLTVVSGNSGSGTMIYGAGATVHENQARRQINAMRRRRRAQGRR